MGWYEKTLESADRTLARSAINVSAHVRRGMALLALGRHKEALTALDRAIEIGEIHFGEHIDFYESGEPAPVSRAHLDAHLDAHLGRGDVLLKLGRREDALAAYYRAIELDPDNARTHLKLADGLFELGHREDALAAYCRSVELDPKIMWSHRERAASPEVDAQMCLKRGNALSKLGLHEDALTAYSLAAVFDPNDIIMESTTATVNKVSNNYY